jgi:hypothetical protein
VVGRKERVVVVVVLANVRQPSRRPFFVGHPMGFTIAAMTIFTNPQDQLLTLMFCHSQ